MHDQSEAAALQSTQPTPIPIPDGFPVTWDEPGDAMLLWERETMHMMLPTTVLDADVQARALRQAAVAFEHYSIPVRMVMRRINTWAYQAIRPVSFDHAELEALGREAEQRIGAAIGSLRTSWETKHLPEIQEAIAWWDGFDLGAASAAELAAHVDASAARFDRLWSIHFEIVIPMLMGISLFDDFYRETLGAAGFEPFDLLTGLETKSVEAGTALWRLAREAAADPALRTALEDGEPASALERIPDTEAGRRFAASFAAYLDTYGRRADGFTYVSMPTWREQPVTPLSILVDYLDSDGRDPEAEHAALAARRVDLLAEARQRLADQTDEVRGTFEFLLAAAETGSLLQEDHNFWLDCHSIDSMRRLALAVGERLVAQGVLGERNDVFHLSLDEAAAALRGATDGLAARVAERTAELARFASVEPPHVLGAFPPGPPPDDPITRTMLKFFGAPPRASESAGEVPGLAGSPGLVRGRARVITSLADAGRLQRGEILVAKMTSPPWTPLFSVAAGIVTDTGGILSHCAIVAREYMIPAVVGTKIGTGAIADGQLIEVDGDAGVVRLLGAG